MAYYNRNNGSFEQKGRGSGRNSGGRSFEKRESYSGSRNSKYSERSGSASRYDKENTFSRYEQSDDRKPYRKNSYKTERRDYEEKIVEQVVETAPQKSDDELPNILMGRNPVKEAIKNGRSIDKILVLKQTDGSLREIISLARDANILVQETDRAKLDELCMPFGYGERTGNHQGIVAYIPGAEYVELSDIINYAKEKNEPPFIILLDSIEDPHNLGSIIRSAECAGAHGVVITKRRSASLTAAACKASAGAVEYVKVARVANLAGAIDRLKDEGLWIAGADMSGTSMHEANMSGAIGLVIGSEGKGISRLIKEKCDFLVSVPMKGQLDSLNAAVAAAILMFEKQRQSK